MPDFKIKTPDGRTVTVRGATAEGAIAYLAQQERGQASAAAPAPANNTGPGGGEAAVNMLVQGGSRLRNLPNVAAAEQLSSTAGYEEDRANREASGDLPWWEKILTWQANREDPKELRSRAVELALEAQQRETAVQRDYPMTEAGGAKIAEISQAETFSEGLKIAASDPLATASGVAQVGLQQAPTIAAALLTRNPTLGTALFGLSSYNQERYGQLLSQALEAGYDLSTAEGAEAALSDTEFMERQAQRGVTRGTIIAAVDMFTAGLASKSGLNPGSLVKNTGYQMAGGAGGEGLAEYTDTGTINPGEMIIEGLAEGVTAPLDVAALGTQKWRSKIEGDPAYGGAAADLARLIREISIAQGNNLKDVRAGGGAKATLEAAHEKISGQISAIANNKDVKARLSPKNVATLEDLLGTYALAQTAIRQGKNKVKSKVTKENADAIVRLLGPYREAAELQQLFDQGDVLTDLFQDGLKGGVSQFTDFLNPFTDNSGNYDPNRSLSTIGSLYGASVVGPLKSAGIVAGGRAVDAVTGRRSKVNRFVKKLEKLTGQKAPEGPSLIAAAQLENQQAEQAKADDAAAKAAQEAETAKIVSTLAGMTGNATDGSPLGTVAVGTGIPAEEIQTVVSELRLKHPADSKNPNDVAINKVLDDAQAGLNGEQRPIRALTQLVNIVNNHLDASLMDGGSSVQRTSLPDQPLAQARAIQMGNVPQMDAAPAAQTSPAPNVETAAPAQPTVNGNQTTTSENYQAGIQANRDTALKLQEQVLDTLDLQNRQASNRPGGKLTPTMLEDEAQALYVALEAVQTENMSIEAMEEVQQLLVEEGVAQENVDKFYKPYIDRVRLQQKRKASMLKQAQATQAALQGGPVVNTQTAPAPSVLEKAQAGQQPTMNQRLAEPISDADLEVNSRVLESVLDDYGVKGKITNASSDPTVTVYELELAPGLEASRVIGLSDTIARSMSAPSAQVSTVPGQSAIRIEIPNQVSTPPQADDSRSVPERPPRQFGEKTDVSMDTNLNNAFQAAQAQVYAKGRDFKLDLQAKSLEAQKREGIDLNTLDDANIDRLADFVVEDALEALKDNENAIGWYGRTVTQALETVGELHPEVLTDPKAKMQFIWATAVTSNGLKVDKNFELALDVYETLKETGRFPTDAGIGQAAAAINSGLAQYHTMLDKFQRKSNSDEGAHNLLIEFMNSKVPVKELEKEYGVKISGEGKNTLVRGASILGPKIGNGFYSNLYGNFDELTMDRWLMRTVGRWRGGLVKLNKPMIAQKTKEIQNMMPDLDIKSFKPLFEGSGIKLQKKMSKQAIEGFSNAIAKASMDPAWRSAINVIPGGENLRKAGNGLAKYLDGQVEAPAGAKERTFIREVFQRGLKRLQDAPSVRQRSNEPLTMSDLQALLWYPEKRLYDTAKQKDGESRGYEDDEAPDYANAARKSVQDRLGQRNRLGSAGAAGPGGGGTIDPNAGPGTDNSIQPALLSPPGPAGGRTPRASAGGASKGRTLARVALAAVKKFVPQVKATFQVGKRGTPEENGIQSIDQALSLAHTLGITVRLFDSQGEMYASRLAAYGTGDPTAVASFYRKGPEAGGKGAEGTVFGLNPGAMLDDGGSVSNIQALSDLIHEIAHGMTLSPLDLNGSQVDDTLFTNPLTGESDRAPMGSFAGSAMRPLLEQTGDADIMAELDNLQLNVDTYTTKDPSQRHALREVRKLSDDLKDWKAYYKKEFDAGQISQAEVDTGVANREELADDYANYMQSVRELAVDPVLVYLINPKLAKAVMPKTAALIRQQFNNAGNNKVKFFNHPAAIVMATVMAMLAQAMAEEEEEKQRMQMPPGALSLPPPGMGALSA